MAQKVLFGIFIRALQLTTFKPLCSKEIDCFKASCFRLELNIYLVGGGEEGSLVQHDLTSLLVHLRINLVLDYNLVMLRDWCPIDIVWKEP